ncbi:class I SAM-dependent methyltransferase [Desulfovibrio fairfieldensis]|uniref:class I SAM-dependent methyltransferase n=1 Tax=Desulfovibrio fairfieldensis TaxID=44742 RepID=UPI0009FA2235|nr:methyltransferase domain-containing protein [Desulfovibrio fairfieldensis]
MSKEVRDILEIHQKSGKIVSMLEQQYREQAYRKYLEAGRVPWSEGYNVAHDIFVRKTLNSRNLMQIFADSCASLPPNYGQNLDERIVEWPWILTHLPPKSYRILDAGSAMNHEHVLSYPVWKNKKLDIMTLAPEAFCAWKQGISYIFHDLRDTPYRDEEFDVIISVSTLEHVGMDNRQYDGHSCEHSLNDVFRVLHEFQRILKPWGTLLFTVPFGRYEDHDKFQQFDSDLLERCAKAFAPISRQETFFLYTKEGWKKAVREDCSEARYAFPHVENGRLEDNAAAARCVACCEWHKKGSS